LATGMPRRVTSASLTPLLVAAEENLHGHISFLQRSVPGMTVLDQEDLLLVDSGLASDTFNKIGRARLSELEADRRIAEAVGYFLDASRPFAWWVGPASRPLDLEDRLRRHSLASAESELGMVMELRDLPPKPDAPRDLVIRRAQSLRQIADSSSVLAANWEPPGPAAIAFYAQTAPLLLRPECPMIFFVGYLDGQPVSTSELFIGGGVAGLYSVATKKEFRRRGLGSALTWAAADHARRQNISTVVLQSSNDGKGVYAPLGFREWCYFAEYTLA
jgi:ribosomal protein S18 acetylase RimI-like enzyme